MIKLAYDDEFVAAIPLDDGDMLVRVINGGGVPYSLIFDKDAIDRGLLENASRPTAEEKELLKWWSRQKKVRKMWKNEQA